MGAVWVGRYETWVPSTQKGRVMSFSQFCALFWKTVSVAVLLIIFIFCICLTGCSGKPTGNGGQSVIFVIGGLFMGLSLLAMRRDFSVEESSTPYFIDSHGMLYRVCRKHDPQAVAFGPMDWAQPVKDVRWGYHLSWQDVRGARLLPAGEDGWVWVVLD